ncbi:MULTISPECIES: sensor histidine kinase [unclassified Paenibacillus]|uniref:ATP-binding protein n=1 Tax=unclassified Paenibacillus TaxID=185978 RepID=UPI001AE8E398|nr:MULTISPECIES: sensor histidine kinase [unclassified Paenibacillus]MBP1155550.1 two-component system sporulation sensor kinase B [Paenibacillus sp. PvP091]MBP1169064.1 two-component system sporulation sensor kinase B [Paenibacillus sp. PvR098]MBP2440092.1 two-component system sporulation sensor kinase B [Paenibacillus sp. PvP052]
MSVIKDFLLQLMLIALPTFTYHTFFAERFKDHKNEKLVMSALWGIAVIFCMSFPTIFGQGYRLDIRIIPVLLGTLYCGYKTGIFLTSLVIVYRFYMGDDLGFYITVLALLSAVPVIILFQKSFDRSKKNKRVYMAVVLSLYSTIAGIVWFCIVRGFTIESLVVQGIHVIFIAVFTGFFTILNENIREIHRLRSEIQNSEKLRVISDLSSVFAHEIRNPMQVARGFLQLLHAPDLSEKKKEYIQLSIEELDRANEIINDLLLFGKPTTNISQRIDVGHQLRRVIKMIETYSISHDVIMKTNISDDCWIYANSQKLNQSLINILKNAIESMPMGGVVWVNCSPIGDEYIEISIKDQGIGMTKEQIARLGSPFYSLKESGTGLGMMVSFQIIRSFEGKVRVSSEKDIGTEFSIMLPKVK